ncbi:hypothetical protein ZIOFF_034361 [Zingiber officinale]|uniref:Glycosyl transferase 48 domain-containing protein n=1 Tax=Zingiber officinale TaxID=94328 RepID=A0A8J5GY64_ZINOF|nr:hypothetical protein ZIOFF_034361 [Zingiber officinale]
MKKSRACRWLGRTWCSAIGTVRTFPLPATAGLSRVGVAPCDEEKTTVQMARAQRNKAVAGARAEGKAGNALLEEKKRWGHRGLAGVARGEEGRRVIYRIKLPGPAILGEGKPENQNHAIIFTRGESLQTIDMNQEHYMEEALKMRNLLQEFLEKHNGMRQNTHCLYPRQCFVSCVVYVKSGDQLCNYRTTFTCQSFEVRFLSQTQPHTFKPDVFDRIFHLTRGGNLYLVDHIPNVTDFLLSGFNSTLREGNVTHHEYMQVGKGRDVGLNQISLFEAKIAYGNGEQTLSRDIYRLGHRFDFFRMLSCYFTTVGFYVSTMVTVLTVYVFLYGRLYLVLSGLDEALLTGRRFMHNQPLQVALASQSFVQLGFLMVLPMVMEIGLERGFRTALSEFILMQLQLASVFFTFSLGTKTHYYGRTVLHGGAEYRATGRGFVVFHAKFADNYRLYSRSHFVKGLELMILLLVYEIFGHSYRGPVAYIFITISMWFMVATWLFAPFLFNPSGFEWQKLVDDWHDWNKWISNHGGIGVSPEKSWESWWAKEQEHLRYTGKRGIILEIVLALRFFVYQYGLVYHLNLTKHTKSVLVYGVSWLIILGVLLVVKIAQACKPVFPASLWGSVRALARGYEIIMGLLLFAPIAFLAWFPFVSEFQTRMLFNQAFSRGLQISRVAVKHLHFTKNSSEAWIGHDQIKNYGEEKGHFSLFTGEGFGIYILLFITWRKRREGAVGFGFRSPPLSLTLATALLPFSPSQVPLLANVDRSSSPPPSLVVRRSSSWSHTPGGAWRLPLLREIATLSCEKPQLSHASAATASLPHARMAGSIDTTTIYEGVPAVYEGAHLLLFSITGASHATLVANVTADAFGISRRLAGGWISSATAEGTPLPHASRC